jgi:hypothetical protein
VKSVRKIIFYIFLLSSISLFAYNPIKESQYQGFMNEGSFVETPTYWGSAVGCIIMGYPAAIVTEPLRLVSPNSPWCDKIGYYMVAGTSKGIGAAFGFFPYLIKKILYDTPLWMFGSQAPEKQKVEPFKLPKELMTPEIPIDIGDIKNKAVSEEDILPDKSLELLPEKPVKKVKYLEEEQAKKKIQLKKEEQKTVEKKQEVEKPKEKPVKKKAKKQPVKVNPNLPSWIHQEIESSEKNSK